MLSVLHSRPACMINRRMPNEDPNVQTGYPLSALFVLLAACAVVSALLSPVVHAVVAKQLTLDQIIGASLTCAILVSILGAVVGLYHYRRSRGVGWGSLVGGLIGAVIGPVMLAPPEAIAPLVTMSLGGSIALLITGAAFGFRLKR
jgi:MFS family permease